MDALPIEALGVLGQGYGRFNALPPVRAGGPATAGRALRRSAGPGLAIGVVEAAVQRHLQAVVVGAVLDKGPQAVGAGAELVGRGLDGHLVLTYPPALWVKLQGKLSSVRRGTVAHPDNRVDALRLGSIETIHILPCRG